LIGNKGPAGDKGLDGEKGERGSKGINGIFGEKGRPGANGDKGLHGNNGEKGDKGIAGLNLFPIFSFGVFQEVNLYVYILIQESKERLVKTAKKVMKVS